MDSEITLLKRAWTLLSHDPILAMSECTSDIERFLDKYEAQKGDTTPCCNAPIVHYRSLNKKVCPDCGMEFDWYLKEGQLPLVKATR